MSSRTADCCWLQEFLELSQRFTSFSDTPRERPDGGFTRGKRSRTILVNEEEQACHCDEREGSSERVRESHSGEAGRLHRHMVDHGFTVVHKTITTDNVNENLLFTSGGAHPLTTVESANDEVVDMKNSEFNGVKRVRSCRLEDVT